MKRRAALAALTAAAATALVPRKSQAKPRIRPPGATDFEHRCIGCVRCAEVCPPHAIRFDERGLAYVDPREQACVLCMKCPDVCPTDALVPLKAEDVRMGVPELTRSKCLPWTGAGVCRLCYAVCPYPDKAVELVGGHSGPLFHPEACTGCGLCEEACPSIAHAIRIVSKP
jgi:formate hydrogenlyase subunit 6/NADH:ubiquinone oxidoreductase subunit I